MKKLITPLIIIIAIAGGVYGFTRFRQQKKTIDTQASYRTQIVERGTLEAIVGATGNVRSNQSATLVWKASGTVEDMYVNAGDSVTKDEILAQLLKESPSAKH